MKHFELVSYHGGHSGEFCLHAEDTLDDVIKAYILHGFTRIGITEHVPPPKDSFRYADEVDAGLDANALYQRFETYCSRVREYQAQYKDQLRIYLAFETESYTGYQAYTRDLVQTFSPDYILGSVHHVRDICFDYSPEDYQRAVDACGGIDNLYHDYFDLQYEMITSLTPSVVAHFDLVRIHDSNYPDRLCLPEIQKKIKRNLALIKELDLILDFNLRALTKGAKEPYISRPILDVVKEMEIKIVPGDDSHGIKDIGTFIHQGIKILTDLGFSTQWPTPKPAIVPDLTTNK
ncbi:MAG: histidinol-phosphatase HisJ family protein [Desulfobacteraceae bacterium]|nr:MAG: histidinol-phosphatase HisJ family protein [Desulfobacteraceae bacterium]